jgi:predicted nucleic acid-binding Zn ribbon protein
MPAKKKQMPLSAKDVSARIDTHEAVCSERWKETIERIKRLEMILIGSAGAGLLLMAGMLWKL